MLFNPYEAYGTAISAEQAAWEALRGHLPGSAQFDPALWREWQEARQGTDRARENLMRLVLNQPVPGRRYVP